MFEYHRGPNQYKNYFSKRIVLAQLILWKLQNNPPTLAFLKKKQGKPPKKARVFLFAETLKSLEKGRKSAQKKKGKSENNKSKENEKKQGLEGQGSLQSKFLRMLSCKQVQTSGSNIYKENVLVELICNNDKDCYKNNCSKDLFCNNFGQDGIAIPRSYRAHSSRIYPKNLLRAFFSGNAESRISKPTVKTRWVSDWGPSTAVGVTSRRGRGEQTLT